MSLCLDPGLGHAVSFEIQPGPDAPLPQQQVIAVVEEGDRAWDIAGIAYRDIYRHMARNDAQRMWPALYRENRQLHGRRGNALRPTIADGADASDDRHLVLEMHPGDRLVVPLPANYESMALRAPQPADTVHARAASMARACRSAYLNADERARLVATFVGLVQVPSPTGREGPIREHLTQILVNELGATLLLACDSICGGPLNLVAEFPATGHFVGMEGMVLNAHLDTIEDSDPLGLLLSGSDGRFFHIREGSFGADDKAGVVVILGSLAHVKHHHWDKGLPHRRVMVALTAEEECYAND
ncbi:MAG: M28 family peptidase, partial [Candidatus Latescibacterota bacterium]